MAYSSLTLPVILDLATAVVPDEIGDPPHYCVDDRQNRDRAPHRKPYLAAAGYVVAVATEYPIGEGPVLSKYKLTGDVGEKLQNEADPKRPEVFDDWQHRPSTGSVLFLVELAFYSIPPGLAGCRIDEVASSAQAALHRMIGVRLFAPGLDHRPDLSPRTLTLDSKTYNAASS